LHLSLSDNQHSDLEKTFEKYKAIGNMDSDDCIKGDGLQKYAHDLGIVDDKDPMMLVIAWKLNALHNKCWELTREEFMGWAIHSWWNIDTRKKKMCNLA